MTDTICGTDCTECMFKENCGGCINTNGKPFQKECVVAVCCQNKGLDICSKCANVCELKEQIISEFNSLEIKDMEKVTCLYSLKGSFVNLEYTLENGQKIKLLDDDKIYLGTQICKTDGKCYGLTADENNLIVCEYGENCVNPELIIYKKRN